MKMEKKILVEKEGKTEEISKEKLEETMKSPDFKVEEVSSTETEQVVKIKQRLLD